VLAVPIASVRKLLVVLVDGLLVPVRDEQIVVALMVPVRRGHHEQCAVGGRRGRLDGLILLRRHARELEVLLRVQQSAS
jgi:hypothetical protein